MKVHKMLIFPKIDKEKHMRRKERIISTPDMN